MKFPSDSVFENFVYLVCLGTPSCIIYIIAKMIASELFTNNWILSLFPIGVSVAFCFFWVFIFLKITGGKDV